jgi:hypothetical protein
MPPTLIATAATAAASLITCHVTIHQPPHQYIAEFKDSSSNATVNFHWAAAEKLLFSLSFDGNCTNVIIDIDAPTSNIDAPTSQKD